MKDSKVLFVAYDKAHHCARIEYGSCADGDYHVVDSGEFDCSEGDTGLDELIELADVVYEVANITSKSEKVRIKPRTDPPGLYNREWVRYAMHEDMTRTVSPCTFTYRELRDENSPLADFAFADVCEDYLVNSKIGEVVFLPPQDADDGFYVLKRTG